MTVSQRIGYYTGPRQPNGCREWTGVVNSTGYGFLYVPATKRRVHVPRLILDLGHGDQRVAMHSCNNKRCVEPSHLSAGTAKQNTRDAAKSGLLARGERHGRAKLTEAQVKWAHRVAVEPGGMSMAAASRALGVNYQTLRAAVLGNNWRHVR